MSKPSDSDSVSAYARRFNEWAAVERFADRLHQMDESERDRRWGRVIEAMPRAEADPSPSLGMQAFYLGYIGGLVLECAGMVDRDNHRAIALGAEALGLDYATAKAVFAALEGASASEVVERFPGFVSFPRSEGFIYFAEDRQAARLKIGFSFNPLLRIDQLSRIAGRPLVLMGLSTGTMLSEHWVHCQLKHARIAAEWFHADKVRDSEFMEKTCGVAAFEPHERAFMAVAAGGQVIVHQGQVA